MSLYAVDRNERKKYRCLLDIRLIFRILAICKVLPDLKSASAAEHHIHDADIADCAMTHCHHEQHAPKQTMNEPVIETARRINK